MPTTTFFKKVFHYSYLLAFLASSLSAQVTELHVKVTHDTVPRFANIAGAGSPPIANLGSGNFSDPAVWPGGIIPGAEARIQITDGTVVTYDLNSDIRFDCFEIQEGAHLKFATDSSTKLIIDELMVMPGGELTIGSERAPISENVSAEIIFRGDTELKTGTVASPGIDPKQYGKGLIVFGKATIYGRSMEKSYLRFSKESLAGETLLELEDIPQGWKVGDTLLIPDTRQIRFTKRHKSTSQAEEVTIASIEGKTVTLTTPLAHDHRGPRDAEGNVGPIELSMLPHVGNLTRNIVFRSETPDQIDRRGHTIFFHRADVDIRYAAFDDLGRTTIDDLNDTQLNSSGAPTSIGSNQKGRYSVHFHHVWGPENPTNTGYQLKLIGSVMNGMRKWGLTVHNTHYGLFQWNIAYDGKGSAIATEDGNEAFNVFERNFVVHTRAGDTQEILGVAFGRGGVFDRRALFGTTRDAFWFSGQHNYVRDNVAANVPDFAYNYNGYYIEDLMKVPRFRGADLRDPENFVGWNHRGGGFNPDRHVREGLPVLESSRNETYSSGQGLWLTWSRGCCRINYYATVSLFEDYICWHINHSGVFAYHESRNTYRGFIMRNDPAESMRNGSNLRMNTGINFSHTPYENGQTIVQDFDIQGFNVGIHMPPKPQDGTSEPNVTLVENGILKNHVNIREPLASFGDGKKSIIRNVHFTPVRAYASNRLPENPVNIFMDASTSSSKTEPNSPSETYVYDFNGEPGNSFRVYFEGQDDSPIAGEIAPCDEMDGGNCQLSRDRAAALNIKGLVFPMIIEQPTLSYEQWMEQEFTPEQIADPQFSGINADPDQDQRSNLLEFAFGTTPLISDPQSIKIIRGSDDQISFSVIMPKDREGIQYIPEISTDLSNWNPESLIVELVSRSDNGDGNESRFYEASDAGAGSLYFRMKVTQEPSN